MLELCRAQEGENSICAALRSRLLVSIVLVIVLHKPQAAVVYYSYYAKI